MLFTSFTNILISSKSDFETFNEFCDFSPQGTSEMTYKKRLILHCKECWITTDYEDLP